MDNPLRDTYQMKNERVLEGGRRYNCCTRWKNSTKIELRNASKKQQSKWYFKTSAGVKFCFQRDGRNFTEALKEILEENSTDTALVCKAAKSQERRKLRKCCGKTKGGRKASRVLSL